MINKVLISEDLIGYLIDRKLDKQFLKCKEFLLSWNFKQIDFKIRKPKDLRIYYFRINKQYRALCKLDWDILKIFDIDNHQN